MEILENKDNKKITLNALINNSHVSIINDIVFICKYKRLKKGLSLIFLTVLKIRIFHLSYLFVQASNSLQINIYCLFWGFNYVEKNTTVHRQLKLSVKLQKKKPRLSVRLH